MKAFMASVLVLAAVGCGAPPTGGGGGGGSGGAGGSSGTGGSGGSGGGGGGTRSASYSCCLNGAFYACPSQAALDRCIPPNFQGTPDPSECMRDTTQDGSCHTGGGGSGGSGGGGGGGGSSGGCHAASFDACVVDSDCHSSLQHCTSGQCYSNQPGSPCNVDSDCGLGHCTSGCCYQDSRGEPCNVDSDCGPASSCVNGTCN
jgi:hypothetical protein